MQTTRALTQFVLMGGIRFYQCLKRSGLLPLGSCRFFPTCSAYAAEALQRYGPWKGGWLFFKRILRCHPGRPGGPENVP